MEIVATQKYLLNSPKKVRVLVNMIRKLKPGDAVGKLQFVRKRSALIVRKVILTAIANAKQRNINSEDLIFKEILVNEGPRLKRWRAGARGRAKPYKRRMSHIRVVLTTPKSEIPNSKSEVTVKSKELQGHSDIAEKEIKKNTNLRTKELKK